MKKNKKSQFWPMTFTGKLIIALIFLVAAIFMIREISEAMTKGYDKQLCKISVLANAKLRIPGAQIEQVQVQCPIRFVTIGLDEILIESGEEKQKISIKCKKGIVFTKGTEPTIESKRCFLNKVNELTADLIFDCWDQFGAGQLQVFSRYDLERQCLICSRIEFKQEVNKLFNLGSFPISASEFKGTTPEEDFTLQEYMVSHNPALHQISYYEFSLDKTDAFRYPYYDYSLDKPYAAVFVAMNENYIREKFKEAWDWFKEWWTGKPVAEEQWFVNTLDFRPYDEVVEICDSLN